MADTKISLLPNALTAALSASGDLIAIVDVSATETKNMTRDELRIMMKAGNTASRAVETDASGNITSSAVTTTELAKLDGLTASTAELNITDGLTASTAELNVLDGYTGDVDDLNAAKTLTDGVDKIPRTYYKTWAQGVGTTYDITEATIQTYLGWSGLSQSVSAYITGIEITEDTGTLNESDKVTTDYTKKTQTDNSVVHLDTLSLSGLTPSTTHYIAFNVTMIDASA